VAEELVEDRGEQAGEPGLFHFVLMAAQDFRGDFFRGIRGTAGAGPVDLGFAAHGNLPNTEIQLLRLRRCAASLRMTTYRGGNFTASVYWQIMSIVRNIAGIAKGMSITFREMLQPTEVENYPDGKGPLRGAVFQDRFRGAHVLQRDENGLEKCVACFLCAAACPSNCIYIEAAENTEEVRISSAERYAKVYNIDYNRCIFCGYCVEACPTDAITHGHGFELATLERDQPDHAQGRYAGARGVAMPGSLAAHSDSVK
jgi:NADH-quinone oxidoreductase subunit I